MQKEKKSHKRKDVYGMLLYGSERRCLQAYAQIRIVKWICSVYFIDKSDKVCISNEGLRSRMDAVC